MIFNINYMPFSLHRRQKRAKLEFSLMDLELFLPSDIIENEIFLNCSDLPSQVSFSLTSKKYRNFFRFKVFPRLGIEYLEGKRKFVPHEPDAPLLALLLVKTIEFRHLDLFYYFYDKLPIKNIFFETNVWKCAFYEAFSSGNEALFYWFRSKIPPGPIFGSQINFGSLLLTKLPNIDFVTRFIELKGALEWEEREKLPRDLCLLAFQQGNLDLVRLLGQKDGFTSKKLNIGYDEIFILAAAFGALLSDKNPIFLSFLLSV